jgi:integrase
MDATIVKELVGHVHTSTTDRYYNYVTMDAMKCELAKFKRPAKEQSNKPDSQVK